MFTIIIPWMFKPNRINLVKNVLDRINLQNYRNFDVMIPEQIQKLEHTPDIGFGYDQFRLFCTKGFNKSWLMNVAAKKSNKEFLIFMDADTIFDRDFLEKIEVYIKTHDHMHHKMFFCWDVLMAQPGKDNPNLRRIMPENTVAMGGIWCAERKFYLETFKGMNETFFGYGGEDNDAYDRGCYLKNNMPIIYSKLHYELVHQYHDWEPPSNIAADYSLITRKNPKEVQDRLNKVTLGQLAAPTPIEMADIKI